MAQYDSYGNLIPEQPPITAQVPKAAAPKLNFGAPVGYNPTDWAKLILGNSGYMGFQLSASERQDIANANRQAALRTLAIRYGGLPQGFSDQYGDIDQGTLDIAKNNPFSAYAQAARKYSEDTFGRRQSLGARGMSASGELPYELGQADYQHASDLYDLGNQFGDAYKQAIQGYADTETGLRSEQMDAIRQAAQDSYNMGYRPTGATSTTPGAAGSSVASVAQSSDSSGNPVTSIGVNGRTFNFGASGLPTWSLVRNATSLPGNTAPSGIGGAMYNADDPTLDANLTSALKSGQQVGVWIVPHSGESAAELGARAAQISKQYGVQVMFDSELSSKGYPGSPQYQYTQDFLNAYQQNGGGQFSVTVQGGGEDDYNYQAVVQAGGTVWIQCYGADPGKDQIDPQEAVNKMLARGVPLSQIGVMLAPGQTAPQGVAWSLYTIDDWGSPTGTSTTGVQPATPPSAGAQAAINNTLSSGSYSPETQAALAGLTQQAYENPDPLTVKLAASRSKPGMF